MNPAMAVSTAEFMIEGLVFSSYSLYIRPSVLLIQKISLCKISTFLWSLTTFKWDFYHGFGYAFGWLFEFMDACRLFYVFVYIVTVEFFTNVVLYFPAYLSNLYFILDFTSFVPFIYFIFLPVKLLGSSVCCLYCFHWHLLYFSFHVTWLSFFFLVPIFLFCVGDFSVYPLCLDRIISTLTRLWP